jgi:hypothetical protein
MTFNVKINNLHMYYSYSSIQNSTLEVRSCGNAILLIFTNSCIPILRHFDSDYDNNNNNNNNNINSNNMKLFCYCIVNYFFDED